MEKIGGISLLNHSRIYIFRFLSLLTHGLWNVCYLPPYKAHPSPGVTTHFSHYKNANCPLVNDHHQCYQTLRLGIQDKENGEQVKQLFVNNIGIMFTECKRIFGEGLTHVIFKEMIKKATERDIWF
ncbi:hypothetical protein [Priestia aryabhattai]|uniref:hypothetical protein n=1 Tax=Priestia aryabhattai TaxID=412384 RepID=UPI003CE962A0